MMASILNEDKSSSILFVFEFWILSDFKKTSCVVLATQEVFINFSRLRIKYCEYIHWVLLSIPTKV
jgi:hypothetical protein